MKSEISKSFLTLALFLISKSKFNNSLFFSNFGSFFEDFERLKPKTL